MSISMSTAVVAKDVYERIHHLDAGLSTVCNTLATVQEETSRTASTIGESERRSNNMELTIGRLKQTLVREPTVIRSLYDEHLRLKITMRYQRGYAALEDDRCMMASTARCSCSRLPYTKETRYRLLKVSMFRLSMTSHCDTCPFSKMAKRTKAHGARYAICSYLLNFSVEATLSLVTGPGEISISPRLSFRNFVPRDAPAFRLLGGFQPLRRMTKDPMSYSIVSSNFDRTLMQLYQLFHERKASPTDVNPDGNTFLHKACELVYYLPSYNPDLFLSYRQFLNGIIDAGVLLNETTIYRRTPLDLLISHTASGRCIDEDFSKGVADISIDLISSGATFSERAIVGMGYLRSSLKIIENIGKRNNHRIGFELGEIAIAVCTKSEDQLNRALNKNHLSVNVQDGNGATPLHLSANWPLGVALLIKEGADVNKPDRAGWLPIHYACMCTCLESVQLLVEAGSALPLGSPCALYYAIDTRNSEIIQTVIIALARRRRRLQRLVEATLPPIALANFNLHDDSIIDDQAFGVWKMLSDYAVPVEKALMVGPGPYSVYHATHMNAKVAQDLFNLGFHDVDGVDGAGRTPMMRLRSTYSYTLTKMIKLGAWFESKKANIYRKLPDSSASVAHQIGSDVTMMLFHEAFPYKSTDLSQSIRKNCHDVMSRLNKQSRDFLFKILETTDADGCLCACCYGGCSVLTMIFKNLYLLINNDDWIEFDGLTVENAKSQFIESLIDFVMPYLEDSTLPSEIIRFATFTRLDLTHTCCNFYGTIIKHLDIGEIEEIREKECRTLVEPEELVTAFEAKYIELGVTTFLQGHWSTKMDEFLHRESARGEEEVRMARQLGIVLERA